MRWEVKNIISVVQLLPMLAFSQTVLAQSKLSKSFDSAGLSSGKPKPGAQQNPGSKPSSKTSDEARKAVKKLFTLEELQIKKIETQIKAINLIIKTETSESKKNELFLRRSQLQLGVARSLGLKRTSLAQMTAEEKQYLQSARKTLAGLQTIQKQSPKKLADIHYLLGLIDYEYDAINEVKKNFYQAIAYDPKHPFITTMAIVLGELEYDQEKYQEAIQIYQKFFKLYAPKEKALADYKTAWSFVGMNQYDNAKQYFLRMIQNKYDEDFTGDAIKDLAFLSVQESSEDQIIAYGNQKLSDVKSRGIFFYYAINQFLAKDKKVKRERLFAELQKLPMDPVQKARVFYLNVQFERSEVPTLASYQAMLDLNQYLATLEAADLSQFLLQDGLRLEDDSEAIIKNFIDAYSGKLQRPENVPQVTIIESAKKLIAIHLRVFPNSNKKEIIYSLWMDASAETKDEATLEYLKNQFFVQKKKPPYDVLYNQAFLKQIILVDEAYIKNPAPHSKKLTELILQFLKEFPKHSEGLKIRKKLAAIYIKEEKFSEALPHLEAIQKEEPQAENLNRLLYVKFKLNLFKEVVNNEQAAKYNNLEIQELMRESSLKMAQKSVDEGSFKDYEVHIKNFLLSNPTEEKAVVAYRDYFDRILGLQNLSGFLAEWGKMKPSLQEKNEFDQIRRQAIGLSFVLGQKLDQPSLLRDSQNAELKYNIQLYQLGHQQISPATLNTTLSELPNDKKTYVLKYTSLLYPQLTVDFLSSKKKISEQEKSLLFDSFLLNQKQDLYDFVESAKFRGFMETKTFQQLRDFFPAKFFPQPKSKLFDQVKAYQIPTSNLTAARYGKMIEFLAENLRFVRKKAGKELTKMSAADQIDFLTVLSNLEKETGTAITNSPLPDGLSEPQIAEYKQGLTELATEFQTQSAEYQTTLDGIKKNRDEERAVYQRNQILILDTDDLLKPKDKSVLAQAIKISQQNLFLALIHVDSLFGQNKISERDHDLMKLHLFLSQNPSAPMRRILGRDLVLQKKQELLDEINSKAKK